MTFFEAQNISKHYGSLAALDDVSIKVSKGSIYGLLGPNGAGKTTLIRIINGITGPDTGKVFLNGQPLKINSHSSIGYLPEERGLYKKMMVGEQAIYLAQLKGMSKKDASKNLKEWFEKFEIPGWWHRKIEELSKGMAQKIQFITTILHNPDLLIFDEPFSGFDPINANLIKNELLELKKNGKTIILSTHDMGSVEELCDDICLINKGKCILEGSVHDVKEKYKKNIVEIEYSGELPVNEDFNKRFVLKQMEDNLQANHKKACFTITNNHEKSELIKLLMELVDLHSFKEVLPTMNEVFISAVQE
ncbi:MAG: ATP-binding cassette domain-containing protein [Bacteroidales bacterium]|nr:ATP-binding cassette domain-containing protein [Bacteroidales bacterium]